MSFKAIVFVVFILVLGVFVYLKFEASGSPNSRFNQTTRFTLGKQPWVRALLGLRNPGDARAEYFSNTGPLVIEWFKPATEDVDPKMVAQFADLAGQYTGRQALVILGRSVSTGTVDLQSLGNLGVNGPNTPAGASILYVAFASDYKPIAGQELSTTLGESTVVISLNAHRQFLGNYQPDLNEYLLSSLLHEFGHELGLSHNPEQNQDPACVMNEHAGIDGQPLEVYGNLVPRDFCEAEQDQIKQLKLQF